MLYEFAEFWINSSHGIRLLCNGFHEILNFFWSVESILFKCPQKSIGVIPEGLGGHVYQSIFHEKWCSETFLQVDHNAAVSHLVGNINAVHCLDMRMLELTYGVLMFTKVVNVAQLSNGYQKEVFSIFCLLCISNHYLCWVLCRQ